MHVALVSPAYAPDLGGGERYVYHLSHALAEQGHRVTIITSNARSEADLWRGRAQPTPITIEKDGALSVIRCRLPGIRGGEGALRVWRRTMIVLSTLLRNPVDLLARMARYVPPMEGAGEALAQLENIDLVHGFNLSWEHPLVRAWMYRRRQPCAFVVTPFAHVGASRAARNVSMKHQRALLGDADRIMALSTAEREGLVLWGIPGSRIDVVGSGYVMPEEIVACRDRYGIAGRYAIYIGRLTYDKGAVHAAEAILALRRQGTVVDLVLVGDSTPEFETFYARLPFPERDAIHPVGRLDEAEKHGLLREADMLLLPSRADALGIVLLEAWAHQKPVIGAQAGGIPGVIDDGVNGYLVPFGDVRAIVERLQRLLETPAKAREMGRLGYEQVTTHYSWSAVLQRTLAGYEQARQRFTHRAGADVTS